MSAMTGLTSRVLTRSGIAHGFLGRTGGVSTGIYSSLNCGPGSGDVPDHIAENRTRAAAALGPNLQLVTLYQIHSANAVTLNEPFADHARPKGDAMATNRPGIALGILTADCAPVLLCDPDARVIGAAHAGWNGAFSGIVESVVTAMEGLGARRASIEAAIGPCISQRAYEVGPEFEARFRAASESHANFFLPSERDGHFRFDLEAFVAERLHQAGVTHVDRLSACTYERDAEFFSFRRTTHRKEGDYGRQISLIALAP